MNKLFTLFLFLGAQVFAQQRELFPPNWFVGLQDTTLQLIIKQKDIGLQYNAAQTNTKGVVVQSFKPTAHKDYVLLDITIGKQTPAGIMKLELTGNKRQSVSYELKAKQSNPQTLQGNDLVYLIMPDRFANGNPQNDVQKGMKEVSHNRDSAFDRHGGDLLGITQHLDYIKDLGATTLWLTPFQENDEASQSYHGYAITNHYKVDSRYGTLADYTLLRSEAQKRNMKWVLDLVFNHIGDGHWLYTDKPFPNAVHTFEKYTRTNYRANTLMDPYASKTDQKIFTEGWFDHHMPDLNNDDPILARYMIQHTIWWIETSQADGIRIDTYSYPEQQFMQQWYQQVIREYPQLSVFGEIWEHAVPLQSYFVPKEKVRSENMQNVLDFQFCFSIDDAVNQKDGWTEGISKLYYTLSQDYVYNDPYHHVIFLDNHDLDRFYSTVNYDLKKMKAALGILLTMRGISSMFYGTELLMRKKGSHGLIREDMQGGWPGDSLNKFTKDGRTAEENEAWNYIQTLAQWRKSNTALSGKMMQFIPEDGVYVYFRYSDTEKVMVVYNSNKTQKEIRLGRFDEMLAGKSTYKNVVSGKTGTLQQTLALPSGDLFILEIK
ncbi:MAG: alpha-amylase family glycosyl hydrolase [Bacteroidota bacterium]